MVYVDRAIWPYKNRRTKEVELWCHMVADSVDELHEFARKVGLRKTWFQHPPASYYPHYDLSPHYRERAIALGATELFSRLKVLHLLRELRYEYLEVERRKKECDERARRFIPRSPEDPNQLRIEFGPTD